MDVTSLLTGILIGSATTYGLTRLFLDRKQKKACHDLQSPMAILDAIARDPNSNQYQRHMLSAVARICDIIGLKRNVATGVDQAPHSHSNSPANLDSRGPIYDAVLIDDDELVRECWEFSARRAGRKLKSLPNPSNLMGDMNQISNDTPIYVDIDLGQGIRGDHLATELIRLGFKKVYLSTGFDFRQISCPDGVLAVVGKEPPNWC